MAEIILTVSLGQRGGYYKDRENTVLVSDLSPSGNTASISTTLQHSRYLDKHDNCKANDTITYLKALLIDGKNPEFA